MASATSLGDVSVRQMWRLLRRSQAGGDIIPVDDIKEALGELGAAVLVLQVIGVLPDVQNQKRSHTPLGEVLVLFGVQNHQLRAERLPGEHTPAYSLAARTAAESAS